MNMKLVIIESPYAAHGVRPWWRPLWLERYLNVRYARACVRHSLAVGEAPIASHLLYTQPGILDDDVAYERAWGIDAGLAWRKVADMSVVYIDRGISQGMKYGIGAARAAGRRVEFRSLYGADASELQDS
jgi:hypothetical protein